MRIRWPKRKTGAATTGPSRRQASVVEPGTPGKDGKLPPEHSNGVRRVQVGCGPEHLRPDWWNTDIRSFEGVDEVMNAARKWRWTDRLEFVYGEHFLEHLDLEDSVKFLTYAGRALAKGGRIRLSTPGLEWVWKTHFTFEEPGTEKHLAETLDANRAFHGWGHQFLYSRGMLEWLLTSLGYARVEFFEYGKSDTPALANLERHGGYSIDFGFPSVWVVEAERGDAPIGLPGDKKNFLKAEFIRHVRAGH